MQHPDFVEAMKKRGIEDFTFLDCLVIPPGYFGTEEEKGRRLGHMRCTDVQGVRNTWPRQIEGLTVVVDLNDGSVVEVVDEGALPMHSTTAEFDLASLDAVREVTVDELHLQGLRGGHFAMPVMHSQ